MCFLVWYASNLWARARLHTRSIRQLSYVPGLSVGGQLGWRTCVGGRARALQKRGFLGAIVVLISMSNSKRNLLP